MTKRGKSTSTLSSRKYAGFRVSQRGDNSSFFVFAALASDILDWSYVDRVADRKGGIQRRLSGAKMRAVSKYFVADNRNAIPTSVVLAFKPGSARFKRVGFRAQPSVERVEFGLLSFKFDSTKGFAGLPAFVVDGQHRLEGMRNVESEPLPVLVSALLEADSNEQAFQFVVINNKASKVPPDLVKSLVVDVDEKALAHRLNTSVRMSFDGAGLVAAVDDDPDSPFHRMVDWERQRHGRKIVKPVAIEGCLSFARNRILALSEDDDGLVEFFFALWSGVKTAYPEAWVIEDGNLLSSSGMKAFFEYLVETIETYVADGEIDVFDSEAVASRAKKTAEQIDEAFWLAEWKLKSLDTSAGRTIIKNDIRRVRQNRHAGVDWFDDVRLLQGSRGDSVDGSPSN